jgi:hypothetical protein
MLDIKLNFKMKKQNDMKFLYVHSSSTDASSGEKEREFHKPNK